MFLRLRTVVTTLRCVVVRKVLFGITTTVRQVEECVNAFKITLPDELMAKIDLVHEE